MKGQSAVDMLLLVLLLSTVLLTLSIFSQDSLDILTIRANALRDKRTLLSVLEERTELRNQNGTILMRGRVVDLLSFQACNGCPPGDLDYCEALRRSINNTLFAHNSGQRHYLLRATSSAGIVDFTAFDNSSTVCLERLPLARYSHNSTCGNAFTIIYAAWFPWQRVAAC